MSLSRRDFHRTAAMAAASLLLPGNRAQAQSASGKKRFGYAIVGLGGISVDHFMPGIHHSQNARVTALVSGHPDKANRLAEQWGVPRTSVYTYQQYDRIRDNPEIDGVYIGLPNSMHAEYTIRAAQAGKHVLCEKPMATTVQDARDMIAACQKAGKRLMIAYRMHLEPANLQVIQFLRSGGLGQPQTIEASSGFNIRPNVWRLNRSLAGGGPLMDIGIYSLNACRYLSGEEPTDITAFSTTHTDDPRFTQVEENVSWIMKFPSGIVASCATTYGADMPGIFRVHGSKGILHGEPAHAYQGNLYLTTIDKKTFKIRQQEKDPSQFTRQADYFAQCVWENRTIQPSGEEGLRDMEYMQQIYTSAGLRMG